MNNINLENDKIVIDEGFKKIVLENDKTYLKEEVIYIEAIKYYPEELYYGNTEYKLKLVNKSRERIQNLITQMEFRLTWHIKS